MKTNPNRLALCAGVAAALVAMTATAGETGEWRVRAGASNISPENDNGNLNLSKLAPSLPASTKLEVDDATTFTFTVSYFVTPNFAIELLGAYPAKHDWTVTAPGVKVQGSVEVLPPTVTAQYHLPLGEYFEPYVGFGVNHTIFMNADVKAPGVNMDLDNSWGLAYQVGLDINLGKKWLLNVDARYIDINSDVDLNSVNTGNVDINPYVYSVNVGYRF